MTDAATHNLPNLDIRPVAPACGAEIHGVDLSRDMSPAMFQALNQALLDHGVIFFHAQQLNPRQILAFAENWGDVHVHPHQPSLEGAPGIFAIIKEEDDTAAIGDRWHTDQMFTANPALGTILYAKQIPPFGGDTMFSNMYMAYDALSDGVKAMLAGTKTVNKYSADKPRGRSVRSSFDDEEMPSFEHPLFRVHPETGRKSLYISYPGITRSFAGMTDDESAPLLKMLYDHATKPEFTCRFRWEEGSVAFWDNRCLLHMAVNDYHGYRREMHRVTIKGDPPIPANL